MSYAKRCLAFYSHILSHTLKKILSTSECSWGHRPRIEMGIVLAFRSCHQLGRVKVSSCHTSTLMSYAKRCLASTVYTSTHLYSPILTNTSYSRRCYTGKCDHTAPHLPNVHKQAQNTSLRGCMYSQVSAVPEYIQHPYSLYANTRDKT